MTLTHFLQATFSGSSAGVVYAVLGLGFVITHRITGVLNFAQGHLAVLGALVASVAAPHMPIGIAVLCGGLAAAAGGAAMYLGAIWPLRSRGLMTQALVTLAVAMLLLSGMQLVFGTATRSLAPFTAGAPIDIAGAALNRQVVWMLIVGLVLTVGLHLVLEKTFLGVAFRACAINRFAAQVVGINVTMVALASFAASGFVSGAMVATQAPLAFVSFGAGLTLTLKGFIAATVAGFESVPMTLVGGIGLGLLEAWSTLFFNSQYQTVVAMTVLLLLLMLRPNDISAGRVSERV